MFKMEEIVGAALTNSFEMSTSELSARAIFPNVSKLNHSCLANANHTILVKARKGHKGQ
jgi:hypothetical protein